MPYVGIESLLDGGVIPHTHIPLWIEECMGVGTPFRVTSPPFSPYISQYQNSMKPWLHAAMMCCVCFPLVLLIGDECSKW